MGVTGGAPAAEEDGDRTWELGKNAKRAKVMKRGKTCALQGHPVRGFKAGTRGMLAAKLGAGGASAADPVAAKLGAGGASAADPVAGAARVGA